MLVGSVVLPTQMGCELCSAGRFASAGTQCRPCIDGEAAPRNGSLSCTPCPAGTEVAFVQGLAVACRPCIPGYVSAAARSLRCSACEAGKFARLANMTACQSCVAGRAASLPGASSLPCSACRRSPHCAHAGSTSCSICIAGKFAASVGSLNCSLCRDGEFSDAPGRSVCGRCAKGHQPELVSSPDGKVPVRCKACPPGTEVSRVFLVLFADRCVLFSRRQALRALCALRTPTATATGESDRVVDGSTKLIPFRRSVACRACPTGQDCKQGSVILKTGQWSYYHNESGTLEVVQCPPGLIAFNDKDLFLSDRGRLLRFGRQVHGAPRQQRQEHALRRLRACTGELSLCCGRHRFSMLTRVLRAGFR